MNKTEFLLVIIDLRSEISSFQTSSAIAVDILERETMSIDTFFNKLVYTSSKLKPSF